ncbi:MAG TPA: hypothetical protein VM030_01545 [Acidimicrobiales bacterium]|nr:hypothetical protein [Acidimicrobiales bacterium]
MARRYREVVHHDGGALDAAWQVALADEELRRLYPDPDFDDAGWEAVAVPGHWRSTPAFADSDGPMLYRTRFEAEVASGRRAWLTFDGIFYQADVWLDGAYAGDTEGYFAPHSFEITDALRERREHVVAVEVACSRPSDLTAKRNLTGVFQHWDCADPDANPGGIWRPVRLEESGPVRLAGLRVLPGDATPESATVSVHATLDTVDAVTVALRTTVAGVELVEEHQLAAGTNQLAWPVVVDRPALWWPHALGDQTRHELAVEVAVGDEVSDRRAVTTGLRQVRMHQWVLTVNGERLFLKGANQGPTRMALAEATPAEIEADVRLARQAGLDLLRVHGHVARAELYEAADREGVLLWQDLPLQWGYARGVRKQAVRQARQAVDLLGHHPSVALWCGHNAPVTADHRSPVRLALQQQLPTWNKTVLDASIKRALEKADPTRPVVAHSGVLPHAGSGGTDSHLYFGWYHGEIDDLGPAAARFPRLFRFVSEFGAQAVPTSAGFMDPDRWPDLDWEGLEAHHVLQRSFMARHCDPADFATFSAWQAASQAYQAEVVRHHVETFRRLKYRPTGGFCQFALADSHPGLSWSVVDHERVPKAGYEALAAACAPVIIVADRPAPSYRHGATVELDIHIVSDLRIPLDGVRATARAQWPGGHREWAWTGDVPADACVRIGVASLQAPATPGVLELHLAVEHPQAKATNRYATLIAP